MIKVLNVFSINDPLLTSSLHSELIPGSLLTLGSFDGLHLGHQSILKSLHEKKVQRGLPLIVMTFQPHPVEVLFPEKSFEKLFSLQDQAQELEKHGVDILVRQKFNKEFSQITPRDFLLYLKNAFNVRCLAVGYDFRFGYQKSGTTEMLKEFCDENQIELMILDAVKDPASAHTEVISSSQIRKKLKSGEVETANCWLGRPFYLAGPVVHGRRLAQNLGAPTANIAIETPFVPKHGVYFSKTLVGKNWYPSVTNIGFTPTVEKNVEGALKVETHLFGFSENIYGETLQIQLLHFHRDELKFSSIDDLKKQIHLDMQLAKEYLSENS